MESSVPLSSELRHNVLLVFKEALNNAVKYAACSEIRISMVVEANKMFVGIEDNGKGFSRDIASGSGNGLQNMEKRVKTLGGVLDLKSQPGLGTRIHLQIPLHR